jgi:hypothetical protein
MRNRRRHPVGLHEGFERLDAPVVVRCDPRHVHLAGKEAGLGRDRDGCAFGRGGAHEGVIVPSAS